VPLRDRYRHTNNYSLYNEIPQARQLGAAAAPGTAADGGSRDSGTAGQDPRGQVCKALRYVEPRVKTIPWGTVAAGGASPVLLIGSFLVGTVLRPASHNPVRGTASELAVTTGDVLPGTVSRRAREVLRSRSPGLRVANTISAAWRGSRSRSRHPDPPPDRASFGPFVRQRTGLRRGLDDSCRITVG